MATDLSLAIAPGTALTFGFTSPLAPDVATFNVLALNQLSGGGNIHLNTEATLGPVIAGNKTVPEPASTCLFTQCLIAAVLGYVRRPAHRRRRSDAADLAGRHVHLPAIGDASPAEGDLAGRRPIRSNTADGRVCRR